MTSSWKAEQSIIDNPTVIADVVIFLAFYVLTRRYVINKKWLGLIIACSSPEIIENTTDEIKDLKIPFGFKANLWREEPLPVGKIVKIAKDGFGQNPVDVLGSRKNITGEKFYDFSKKMANKGATILGGCCEIKPSHIKAISKLKQI